MHKARKYLKEISMQTFYYFFVQVYPYFTYCVTVWGNTFNSVLEPLIVLQKCAIGIICGAQKFHHTYHTYHYSKYKKILPLVNLYVHTAKLFLYKYCRKSFTNIIITTQGKLNIFILILPNHLKGREHQDVQVER